MCGSIALTDSSSLIDDEWTQRRLDRPCRTAGTLDPRDRRLPALARCDPPCLKERSGTSALRRTRSGTRLGLGTAPTYHRARPRPRAPGDDAQHSSAPTRSAAHGGSRAQSRMGTIPRPAPRVMTYRRVRGPHRRPNSISPCSQDLGYEILDSSDRGRARTAPPQGPIATTSVRPQLSPGLRQ